MKLNLLLLGVSLLASQAWAGSISNVPGTLDTTLIDPAPALYPHFVCASGCNSGSNTSAVSQSGAWSVGVTNFPAVQSVSGSVAISNFPTTQPISGTVTVPGVATSANQPALGGDGGGLSHITNFPATQSVTGAVSITNLPATQTISGTVAVPGVASYANQPALGGDGGGLSHITNFPATQSVTGAVSITNLPATQTISGSVTVNGVATSANQPALSGDGGGLSHITNFPATQPVSGAVSITNLPATQPVSGSVTVNGVATSANQPALNGDGGSLAHITNLPATQPISATDGSNVTIGSTSDAQCLNSSGTCSAIALLKAMLVASSGPIPSQSSSVSIGGIGLLAGTAKVGQVAIDQTTLGSTNAIQQVSLAPVSSTAAESCHVLKASPGLLMSVSGYAGQAEFIQVFNTATAPADSSNPAPVAVGYAGAPGFWALNWTSPLSLSTGITVCDSSTGPLIKTAISTNNTFSGQVQ
jgi:hypothetical protein